MTKFLTTTSKFRLLSHVLALAETELYMCHCGLQVRSVVQNNEATRHQKDTDERVNTAVITEEQLAEMVPPVLEGLKEAGYFTDDIKIGNALRLHKYNKESHCFLTSPLLSHAIMKNNSYYKTGCQNVGWINLAQHKVQ